MVMSADDKKDDKKDKEKHQPVVIVIYLPPWSPVMREASLPDCFIPTVETTELL